MISPDTDITADSLEQFKFPLICLEDNNEPQQEDWYLPNSPQCFEDSFEAELPDLTNDIIDTCCGMKVPQTPATSPTSQPEVKFFENLDEDNGSEDLWEVLSREL